MGSERTEADSTTAAASTLGMAAEPEGRTADRSEAAETGLSGRRLVEFRCIRNAEYHEDRERHYARVHRFMMFIVIAVGTSAFGASLVHGSDIADHIATAGTGAAVLAGLVDLLWNVDGLARLHSSLRRRCYDLLARLEANEALEAISVEFTRIVADEPPAMHAVNALAFNAAVDALGRPQDQKYRLEWWQALLRHWIRFQPNEFPTIAEAHAVSASRQ